MGGFQARSMVIGSSYVAFAPGIVLLDHGFGNVDANTTAELGPECLIAG